MSHSNSPRLSLIRFYEAEARYSASGRADDRKALLKTLDADIRLHQPESLPYGGTWEGREGFGRWLWSDIKPMNPVIHNCGEKILICSVTMRATARITGASVEMPMCQVIRFSRTGPLEWRNFAWNTAAMVAVLGASVSARGSA
jgi:hypothetical protein